MGLNVCAFVKGIPRVTRFAEIVNDNPDVEGISISITVIDAVVEEDVTVPFGQCSLVFKMLESQQKAISNED
jgi:hypothetical protein